MMWNLKESHGEIQDQRQARSFLGCMMIPVVLFAMLLCVCVVDVLPALMPNWEYWFGY